MILVGGIHGVGKSFFCRQVHSKLGINFYSASSLISASRKAVFTKDKLVADAERNQPHLIAAKKQLDKREKIYLLDGHFCLLGASGKISRIGLEVFHELSPRAIVLLTEIPSVIAARRRQRDGIDPLESDIKLFQNEEKAYATEVAALLSIPLYVSKGADHIDTAMQFVHEIVEEEKYAW